ncbi:MAG: DEAD/DEAH box helicase [Chloroflexota bacterium]
MAESLLAQLDVDGRLVAELPAKVRNQLLSFLLRWEQYQDALDCLLAINRPGLVTLLDMQAKALDGLGRTAEAVAIMQTRLEEKYSLSAQVNLGYYLLHVGNHQAALATAQEITRHSDAPAGAWSLLGEVSLLGGDLETAEAAYLRHLRMTPGSRQPLVGLMRLYEQRGDPVTAAAYAVRAYTVEEGQYDVQVYLLRQLRDYFARTGDPNHLTAVTEQLATRFQAELTEIKALLAGEGIRERAKGRLERREASPAEGQPPMAHLPDLNAVPVSDQERAELEQAASTFFGFTSLLEAQPQIMACARRGENVLAILRTGGGKSLCYQLPAVLDEGLTLVISPLIALMKDQVDNLPPTLRPRALALNSTLDNTELQQALVDIGRGRYRLVYAAPERLRQPPFLHAVRRAGLSRLVIDEAHCVSIWGHDFRPDYLTIAQVCRDLGRPPILAMTATAPPRVREDIERRLFGRGEAGGDHSLPDPSPGREREHSSPLRVIAADTYRANLHLSAIKARDEDEKLRHLLHLCQQLEGSGIIYARTRQNCEEIADLLRRQGLDATHYHAGMENRAQAQDNFMSGRTRLIVATIAFGMGVDKPDIRFIIHYGLPASVEAYYQEAGRAGRDGQPAYCILLHSASDKATLNRHANQDVVTIEFLRAVYAAVRRRLNGRNPGPVALDDLARDAQGDDTAVRVALSALEQAGLVARHHDAPRTVTLRRLSEGRETAFDHFAEAAHLRLRQSVTRNFTDLVETGLAPAERLEELLLTWQAAGYLEYQANGRDGLLTLLPAPAGAATRIESLLNQYKTIQQQRVAEIVAYARTRRCRHGFLANYLGGASRATCEACDNCQGDFGFSILDFGLDESQVEEQRRLILTALKEMSWGRQRLIHILRGDSRVDERGRRSAAYGQLKFRSESAVGKLIGELLAAGLVQEKKLGHGGIALELTADGRLSLQQT